MYMYSHVDARILVKASIYALDVLAFTWPGALAREITVGYFLTFYSYVYVALGLKIFMIASRPS